MEGGFTVTKQIKSVALSIGIVTFLYAPSNQLFIDQKSLTKINKKKIFRFITHQEKN